MRLSPPIVANGPCKLRRVRLGNTTFDNMTTLIRGLHSLASLAAPQRLGLLSFGVAALIASATCVAQPIDLDVGFGTGGTVYAPNDAPGSNNRDRTVALFPIDTASYAVVAETANASGGVSPTFIRLTRQRRETGLHCRCAQ
jgi:hypothetical protein